MAIALHQRHYRFGLDNGTEATHTWHAAEDTPVTLLADVPFLLRIAVWEEGGTNAPNTTNQFQCRRNGGAWQNITTTSTICKAVAVAAFANGDHCTQRLTARSPFEANAQGCTEDGNSGGNQNDILANGSSETEAGLQLVGADLVSGDTIEFRVTTTPAAISVYDVIPSATVQKSSVSPSRSGSLSPSVSSSLSESVSASRSPSTSVSVSESVSASYSPGPGSLVRIAYLVLEVPNATQFSRPTADVAAGTWTPSSGSDLYVMLDETSASDADYIRSGADPVDDTAKLAVTGIILPGPGTITLRLRGKWTEAT